jgi:hypothetical protein
MIRRTALVLGLLAGASCASEESEGDVTGPGSTSGATYTAIVSEVRFSQSLPPSMLVTLNVTNPTAAPLTLTYPAGCAVRIRLYRALDDSLAYDETKLPCSLETPASVTLSPHTSLSMGSGFRGMLAIAGDSLALTLYRVTAVPGIEGDRQLEVAAGNITLKQ